MRLPSPRLRNGLLILLGLLATLALFSAAAAAAPASPGHVLVFGREDNGVEISNTVATLTSFGVDVDRAADLPGDLSAYDAVWYVEGYSSLTPEEATTLSAYVSAGGSAYLTGERPCCEDLNVSVQGVLRSVLKDQDVVLGGQGDIDGPFAFNTNVTDYVASYPNLLVDFLPDSPGALDGVGGVSSRNVFASNGQVAVGGVWSEQDMISGKGRIALLMDIDYLGKDERDRILENIHNFLMKGVTCQDNTVAGLRWTNGPAPCTVLLAPGTASWSAHSDQGPVTVSAVSPGGGVDCAPASGAHDATLVCTLSASSSEGVAFRIEVSSPEGKLVRRYRTRPKNDPRNVPVGFADDSNWWQWPDADRDGLPDKWEEDGVWVKGAYLNLPAQGADPRHKDLFLHYDFQQGQELPERTFDYMRDPFLGAPLANPDGQDGVDLHILRGSSIPDSVVGSFALDVPSIQRTAGYSGFLASPWAGGGGVPQLAKWLINLNPDGTNTIGQAAVGGTWGYTAWDPSRLDALGNLWQPTQESLDFARASNAVHELGHELGLRHHGAADTPVKDDDYRSVMSYSYSNFGLPSGFLGRKHYIDYSREDKVNLDWRVAQGAGAITFIGGQWGERPNFYAANNEETLDVSGPQPTEPTTTEALQATSPAAFQSFLNEFGLDAIPGTPTIQDASASVSPGASVRIPVPVGAPAGSSPQVVIDQGPTLGSARVEGTTIVYTAASASGTDTLRVHAVAGPLGSTQATVTVQVRPGGSGPGTPTAGGPAAKAPKLRLLGLTRLAGRSHGRIRVATLRLRSDRAGRLQIRVAYRTKACAKRPRCAGSLLFATSTPLKAGVNRIVLAVPAKALRRSPITLTLTPRSLAGVKGTPVVRTLVVKAAR